jgi:hypothetical protein
VNQWDDESNNNHHATQPDTGFRPTYRTDVINGKPVVRFDDQFLRTDELTEEEQPITVTIVYRLRDG